MPATIAIPGRRISDGEEFKTDWVPRGGDCFIVRAECLSVGGGDGAVSIAAETRGEDGSTITGVTQTAGDLALNATQPFTGLFLASTSTSPGNGSQEQVRLILTYSGAPDDYAVVRVFPILFFDSSKPY